ncbi:protein of unknown function [Pararobbsia alpina]
MMTSASMNQSLRSIHAPAGLS